MTKRASITAHRSDFDLSRMRANADQAAALLRSVGNAQRLLVLCQLAEGECSVGQLNERLELSQSALSQHLAKLREAGLVRTRRDAQSVFYRLSEGPVEALLQTLHGIYCR